MKALTLNLNSLVVGIFIVLSACGGGKDSGADSDNKDMKGAITIDGSSTVYPITEAVAEEFNHEYPKVKVTIGVSGTGGGFKKFSRGEIDISDASRPIKEAEIAACKENNIEYSEFSVAYDGLAVLINPENTWVDHFTVEELKKIWEPDAQGKIMKWNQIRPEWPDQEIHLFGPGIASGTYDYFTEAIVGKSGSSRGDFTASEDDNVLVQGISGDKLGLGFFGLAYYAENKDKLKLVGVDGGKGVVLPSLETVKNGTYSPLSRPLFIYVNNKALEKPEVSAFVEYYLKNTSTLSSEVGYIPLPQKTIDEQLEIFTSILNLFNTKGPAKPGKP